MDTDSFIVHVKAEEIYEDIAKDVEKWFDGKTATKIKKQKIYWLFIRRKKKMKEFVGLKAKNI